MRNQISKGSTVAFAKESYQCHVTHTSGTGLKDNQYRKRLLKIRIH